MFDLGGRTALVTGGSRGIGRAACLGFARAGADVVVHYRSLVDEAEAAVEEISSLGRRATTVQADVTRVDEVRRMLSEVEEFSGDAGLHVLFNNAGVYPPGTLESLSVEEWDRRLRSQRPRAVPRHAGGTAAAHQPRTRPA